MKLWSFSLFPSLTRKWASQFALQFEARLSFAYIFLQVWTGAESWVELASGMSWETLGNYYWEFWNNQFKAAIIYPPNVSLQRKSVPWIYFKTITNICRSCKLQRPKIIFSVASPVNRFQSSIETTTRLNETEKRVTDKQIKNVCKRLSMQDLSIVLNSSRHFCDSNETLGGRWSQPSF